LTRRSTPAPGIVGTPGEPVVLVVDDELAMREALESLFRSVGLSVRVFASTTELMRGELPSVASCLVLDIRLPGVSGLDLQSDLAAAGIDIPIIFMTGHGDIPMSVQAMKAGAIDFLTKPFRQQDMIHAVNKALATDRKRRDQLASATRLQLLFQALTRREREILAQVARGSRNKRIAADLGISEVTVKVHRAHLMRKMQAKSLADLVRMADSLGVGAGHPAKD
jgi:FixJ family two-component response regulator